MGWRWPWLLLSPTVCTVSLPSTTPTLTGQECQGLGSPPPATGVTEGRSAVLSPMATLSNMSPLARGAPMLSLLSSTTATPTPLPMLWFLAQLMESTRLTQEQVTPFNMSPGLTFGEDKQL